ncbi:MAG: hypothetical protein KGI89_15665 [Euryarchaeota archaeon]|nr:hypothetical protein [Euryarchaeota archaeon]
MVTQNTNVAVPPSTGIGAPGTEPAPASLARSPMAAGQAPQASRIPFTRGSSLATMVDQTLTAMAAGIQQTVKLQTNAFLEALILDVNIVGSNGGAATVKWQADGPFAVFGATGIQLTDPANQAIITPISGFRLAQLNKYLADTECNFDPARDAGFFMLPTAANNGTGSTATNAGTANFRLVIPIELRRRDALGALTNSAANEAMNLILTPIASYAGGTDTAYNLFSTAPSAGVTVNVRITQLYWTAPPQVIVTGGAQVPTAVTPAGIGTVGFIRSERHNEVSGGGTPPIQLTSVGDIISCINWTLRTTTGTNTRDAYTAGSGLDAGYANWPNTFNFAVNDFTTLAITQDVWIREMSRFYGLFNGISAVAGNPGYLDAGVFTFGSFLAGLFDEAANFSPANQYLATEAGTKLQVRGSTFGAASSFLEVDVRVIRPTTGDTLYA